MVRDRDEDVVVGDSALTTIAPELFTQTHGLSSDPARMMTRGLRHAPKNLQLVLTATAKAPRIARRALADLARDAGASERELDVVRTVVSEAVTNVVRHAYDDGQGLVHVDAAVIADDLTILVADDGHGPRVPSADPGLGLGWKLMAQMTDRWAIVQRGGGGTMVYMRVALAARSVGGVTRI